MSTARLFEDYNHTALYKKYRPGYPESLIDRIVSYLKENHSGPFDLAVDVGCGNGQATKLLTSHFISVHGYDVSENQIRHTSELESQFKNLKFFTGPSENLENLKDASVDLVVVATAIHWFDLNGFFQECKRVLKPNTGTLAIFGCALPKLVMKHDELGNRVEERYQSLLDTLRPYFAKETKLLLDKYVDVKPPFNDIVRDNDSFKLALNYTIEDMANYIRTWSPYQTYLAKYPQANLLDDFENDVKKIFSELNRNENEFQSELDIYLILCRN